MEEWRDIPGFEGLYQASSLGRVKSLQRKHELIMRLQTVRNGYIVVSLRIAAGTKKLLRVHRLVAQTFIPNKENKPEVNHKDGNKENNIAQNLEWVTSSENHKHAYKTNIRKNSKWAGYVNIYLKNGDFIIQVENTKMAAKWIRENTEHYSAVWQGINDACRNRRGCKTAYGFIFKYTKEKVKTS
jgi:hypothetical protein